MSLLSDVLRVLDREKAQTALIGAAALAVRGVSRSTTDTDLLCVDAQILRKEVWAGFEAPGREVRILKGDWLGSAVRPSSSRHGHRWLE